MRMIAGLCLALVFAAGAPATLFAQPVMSVTALAVPADQRAAFLDLVPRMRAMLQRHEPQVQVTVFAPMLGSAPGNRVVVMGEYPSAEAWGAVQPKLAGDADVQQLTQEFRALGAEVISIALRAKATSGPSLGQSGSVAMLFNIAVPPDQVAAFLALAPKIQSVIQEHEPQNQISVYAPVVTRPPLNRYAVFSEFPRAAAWGAVQAKLAGDPDFARLGQEGTALGIELLSVTLLANITPACCR